MMAAICSGSQSIHERDTFRLQAFAERVVKLGTFVMTHSASIRSIDINPVLIRPQGLEVVAVDALVESA